MVFCLLACVLLGVTDARFGEAAYDATVVGVADTLTPETVLKAEVVHPCPPAWLVASDNIVGAWHRMQGCNTEYLFAPAQARVDWARTNGMKVHGHTLVWERQTAAWMRLPMPADAREQVLEAHVRDVTAQFCGAIDTWDVVNEPLTAGLATWGDSKRVSAIAFKAAQTGCAQAELWINEAYCYDDDQLTQRLLALAAAIRATGGRVDGIAAQCHMGLRKGETVDAGLRIAQMMQIRRAGLNVAMSEVDVMIYAGADETEQALGYANLMLACRVAGCQRFSVWGIDDPSSWLNWVYGKGINALPFSGELCGAAYCRKPA